MYIDVLAACPGRARPIPVRPFWRERSQESCRVAKSHPFAGGARSHSPLPQGPLVVLVDGNVGALGDGVVVDDHFRRRVVLDDAGADALAEVVGVAQRQGLVHVHVQLDELGAPGLARAQVVETERVFLFGDHRADHVAHLAGQLMIEQQLGGVPTDFPGGDNYLKSINILESEPKIEIIKSLKGPVIYGTEQGTLFTLQLQLSLKRT